MYSVVSYLLYTVVDQLPRLGKRELVFLLLFTCSFVVSVLGRFLFLLVLGMDCAFFFIVALPGPSINYFTEQFICIILTHTYYFFCHSSFFVFVMQLCKMYPRHSRQNTSFTTKQKSMKTRRFKCRLSTDVFDE